MVGPRATTGEGSAGLLAAGPPNGGPTYRPAPASNKDTGAGELAGRDPAAVLAVSLCASSLGRFLRYPSGVAGRRPAGG